jgi:hypothetical protein
MNTFAPDLVLAQDSREIQVESFARRVREEETYLGIDWDIMIGYRKWNKHCSHKQSRNFYPQYVSFRCVNWKFRIGRQGPDIPIHIDCKGSEQHKCIASSHTQSSLIVDQRRQREYR